MNKHIPVQLLNRLFLYIFCCGGAAILIYLINLRMSLKLTPGSERDVQSILILSTEKFSIQNRKNIDTKKEFHYQNVTILPAVNISDPQLFPNQRNHNGNFNNDTRKEWYYRNGNKFPTVSERDPQLFFDGKNGDRILEQLMYLPKHYLDSPKKIIMDCSLRSQWEEEDPSGSNRFSKCPVNKCLLTKDKNMTMKADAIIYQNAMFPTGIRKPAKQLWIMYSMESPYKTKLVKYPNVFNWTATYRHDSDLVVPYGRWNYYNSKVTQKIQTKNYAANRTKQVAWVVSHCETPNGRLAYALELRQYIQIDIYGKCGLKCPQTKRSACFEMLKHDYKFYLAFENSNCREYITEKYYENSVNYELLPIVMGAPPEDYERNVPKNSYIHVDDFATPEDLGNYLHRLDNDDELYNSYFKWKGTGEFIKTHFWCRLCTLLHFPFKNKYYEDINKWYREPGVCRY